MTDNKGTVVWFTACADETMSAPTLLGAKPQFSSPSLLLGPDAQPDTP